jgi:hypothetical protein
MIEKISIALLKLCDEKERRIIIFDSTVRLHGKKIFKEGYN